MSFRKNKHHLFTYYEVRDKLVQMWGKPKTDKEHDKIHKEIKRVRKIMPTYLVDIEHHARIHSQEVKGRFLDGVYFGFISAEFLMKVHPELNIEEAESLKEYAKNNTIIYKECYGDGSIIFPEWKKYVS